MKISAVIIILFIALQLPGADVTTAKQEPSSENASTNTDNNSTSKSTSGLSKVSATIKEKVKTAANRVSKNDNRPVFYGKEHSPKDLNSRQIFSKENSELVYDKRQTYNVPPSKTENHKKTAHSTATRGNDPYQGHNFRPRYWKNVKPRYWSNVRPRYWKNVRPRHCNNFVPHQRGNFTPRYGANVIKSAQGVNVRAFRYDKSPDAGSTLARVKKRGKLRIGVYLQFKGLSFMQDGKPAGLDIALAKLMCEKLSEEVDAKVEPEFVSASLVDIVRDLRKKKYDVIFSALIPSPEYSKYRVTYSTPYLITGPAVCCQAVDGVPKGGIDGKVASLKNARIVIIDEPAAREALRRAGIYVPADQGKLKTPNISFPLTLTRRVMNRAGEINPTVPLKQIIQLGNIDEIYRMLAAGKVDAGVIDLPIVWWASHFSEKYRGKIHVFRDLVAQYDYVAVTRNEDQSLSIAVDKAIRTMRQTEQYRNLCRKWQGSVRE